LLKTARLSLQRKKSVSPDESTIINSRNAAAYCLKEAGLEVADLDYVGFYDKPLLKFERLLETSAGGL